MRQFKVGDFADVTCREGDRLVTLHRYRIVERAWDGNLTVEPVLVRSRAHSKRYAGIHEAFFARPS